MAQQNNTNNSGQLVFEKVNYLLTAVGALMVVVGFFLMSGGGSEDPSVFNEEIFSFTRVTLAPIVILAGYGVVFFAIMKKPK